MSSSSAFSPISPFSVILASSFTLKVIKLLYLFTAVLSARTNSHFQQFAENSGVAYQKNWTFYETKWHMFLIMAIGFVDIVVLSKSIIELFIWVNLMNNNNVIHKRKF